MAKLTPPTPEQLGIPSELYDRARHYVIKNKREGRVFLKRKMTYFGKQVFPHPSIPNRTIKKDVWDWVNTFTNTVKNGLFGVTLIEMLQYYLLDFGFVYGGMRDENNYMLVREENGSVQHVVIVTFDDDKKTMEFNVEETSDQFNFEWKTNKRNLTTGKIETTITPLVFSAEEIAQAMGEGVTADEVMEMEDDYWTGVAPQNENEVKEVYSVIVLEDGVVTADLFINGKSWTEFSRFGDLVFPFGKAGQDFQVQWRLFDGNTDPNSNLGESWASVNYKKDSEQAKQLNIAQTFGDNVYSADTHTLWVNPNKPAWLKYEPELLPDQGKNPQYAVYINLHNGNVTYTMSDL